MLTPAHHDGSPLYVSSMEPALGEMLTLRLRTHRDHQPALVVLRTVHDGEPFVAHAEVTGTDGVDTWWSVQIEARNTITHYRWLLAGGAYDYSWLTAAGIVDHDVPDATDFVITALPAPPAWANSSVVYQVFPDRFARGSQFDQDAVAGDKYGQPLPEWAVPRAWADHPEGRSPNTPFEFFGGDLDGIREHLDHLQALGVDTLYMTPIFPAGSTHRYDAATFDHVDPLLGGDRALAELNREAHTRGMQVIGDITLNHCGATHEWFLRAQDPNAREREFFRFGDQYTYGYVCWWDIPSLPKFDHTSVALRDDLVRAPGSSIRRWVGGLEGFDGWRVDVANMSGRMGADDLTHELARDTLAAMAAEDSDLLLVAEHGHDASADLLGDGWHGTMNYAGFTRQVWCWLRAPEFAENFMGLPVEIPVISGTSAVASIRAFHGRIPWRSLLASWNILGSHDTARIRTVVGTAERQVAAFTLAVALPGVPMIFAGDEIGETGWWGEDARTTFPWHHPEGWESGILEAYTDLIRLRRTSDALATGGLRWIHEGTDALAFVREHPQESLLIVVSRGQAETIRIPLADLNAAGLDYLFGLTAEVAAGHAVIDIPHAGAGIWRLA